VTNRSKLLWTRSLYFERSNSAFVFVNLDVATTKTSIDNHHTFATHPKSFFCSPSSRSYRYRSPTIKKIICSLNISLQGRIEEIALRSCLHQVLLGFYILAFPIVNTTPGPLEASGVLARHESSVSIPQRMISSPKNLL